MRRLLELPLARDSAWWVPAAALLLALLLWASPLHETLTRWVEDRQLSVNPRKPVADDVLVVDIDDASLAELRPLVGGWPLGRDVHALTLRYLREAGASVVVYNLLFADARDGDDAFALALPGTPEVVLAASGQRAGVAAPRDSGGVDRLAGATALDSSAPAFSWPELLLPTTALASAAAHLGVISAPLDDDDRLRALPTLHRTAGLVLPSLPVAALMAATPGARLEYDAGAGVFSLGSWRWPVDRRGRFEIATAHARPALQSVPFARLVQAAMGVGQDDALRALLRGRAVFIGSSAAGGSTTPTAFGPMAGTELQAAAYGALRSGALPRPAGRAAALLLALAAWLPALATGWRGRPQLRRDAVHAAIALAFVIGIAWLALTVVGTRIALAMPLVLLAGGLAFAALAQLLAQQAAQRRLESERRVADAASQAKSEFLANVSHEIRTPLNALLGVSELLAETELSAEQRQHVEVFRRAGENLSALINDLLDLAKIEAGRLELRTTPFDLRQLIEGQIELLHDAAKRKGLRLESAPEAQLPSWVQGDPLRLAQVLTNLLGNAVKFTRYGSVTLAVQREREEPARLIFSVRDTGSGIEAERLEAIFQPFTQADGSVTREYGGTGLGLTISRHLVERMGGTLEVESTPDQGSTFRFGLLLPPVKRPPAAAPAAAVEAPPQGLAILLAEDNPSNVYLVQQMLKDGGHRIDVVTDGVAALERWRHGRYDVVLMDVQMPRKDGLSTARELRRLEAQEGRTPTPVIALTANAYDEDVAAARAAGCDEHLAKPVRKAALLGTIGRLTRRRVTAATAAAAAPLPAAVASLAAEREFDVAAALDRLDGDAGLYLSMLERARSALAAWSAPFEAALAGGDLREAGRHAHDLKGMAAAVGATRLAEAAQRAESTLRLGAPPAPALRAEVAELLDGLRTRLEAALQL